MTPTPASSTEAMLAYWQSLVAPEEDGPWGEDDVNYIFHHFRPHGVGVERVFDGVVRGDEILPRLLEVYARTAIGSPGVGLVDAYLTVREPQALSASAAASLCSAHLISMMRLIEEFSPPEYDGLLVVSNVLNPLPKREVVKGRAWDIPVARGGVEGSIYEVVCELTLDLKFHCEHVDSHGFLLEEAFYYIACDYLLQRYLSWPLYRDLADIEEPFAPYFELWKHGADYRFTDDHHVTVYVPNLVD